MIRKFVQNPVAIIAVVLFSLGLVYLCMDQNCSQYGREIKRLEDQYAELENDRVREETRWNSMKGAEQLDQLLTRNGMVMVYPNAAQIVRISGIPRAPAAVAGLAATDTLRGATRLSGVRPAAVR
jgi:hypothetical protein